VNNVFWKLHGWVDERIDRWAEANNVDEIEWTGTWEGPHEHIHPPHETRITVDEEADAARLADMEDAVRLAGAEIVSRFPPASLE
jgi:hypothetical protein